MANPRRLSHRIFYRESSKSPNAKWFDAVKEGNLAEIKRMVEAGQDIEVQDTASLKQTALGWAAFIGYLDVVQYLVDKGQIFMQEILLMLQVLLNPLYL